MKFWAQKHVAAAFVVLYLALYAGYAATHSIGGGDQTSFIGSFALETLLMLLWWLIWSAASWLHARRNDLVAHLSITALGGTVCIILLFAVLPWLFYLIDAAWTWNYFTLARTLGMLCFAMLSLRLVTGHLPLLKLWVGLGALVIGLQGIYLWSEKANDETQLPFEPNIVVPIGSPIKTPDLIPGLDKLWSGDWK
jgi:hypothetical protein